MAITSNDIKLMQPERLTDNEDGGGQMTGRPVIDGDINNLFEDISRVNRTYGNVSLRKAFLKVDTATADLYLDAHTILSAQPQDPKVTGLLFTTENFYDTRDAARQRVESFVIPSTVSLLSLRGTQLQGQQTIICYAPRVNAVTMPEVGVTLVLQIGTDLGSQQFIKVVRVEHSVETFTYAVDDKVSTFVADQYILRLSSELTRDYPANDPHPYPRNNTKIYSTQPSQSAKYYGTTTLAADATAGSTSIRVSETFAPIIPTAASEKPVIDQRPGGFVGQAVPSSANSITLNVPFAPNTVCDLPTAIVPGSISVTLGGTPYTDKAGALVNASGSTGALAGTVINYLSGAISWAGSAAATTVAVSYKPAVLRQHVPNTGRITIDDTNRNFNYVLSLDPVPAPLTFNASYQYLGKWYELRDDGTGLLVGDGSGQINYQTGSIILTLKAQPDASSVIFYRWTEAGIYRMVASTAFAGTTKVDLRLPTITAIAGTVVVTWVSGGVTRTANDSANPGVIAGAATGTVDYGNGVISLINTLVPDAGTSWTLTYTHKSSSPRRTVVTVPNNTTRANIVLETAANVQPGSISFSLRKSLPREVRDGSNILLSRAYVHQYHNFTDNGAGALIDRHINASVGTVNYGTGQIVLTGTAFLNATSARNLSVIQRVQNGADVQNSVKYSDAAFADEIISHSVAIDYLLLADAQATGSATLAARTYPWRFSLSGVNKVLPGSVILTIGTDYWFDNGTGNFVRNYNVITGVGEVLGTIDYETSSVVIDDYVGRPATATVATVACVVGETWTVLKKVSFRSAAAPLRPNGFNVRANNFATGVQYNAQADNQGTLSGDGVTGAINLQNGVADISFPAPVLASSLFYNAVSFNQIPLDPDILGLDPVRLPADGRVPILRDADIVVLTHTQKDAVAAPAAGLVVQAGRTKLYSAWFEDTAGTRLNPAQYTLNKDTGTATLATPFVAQGADNNALVGDLFFVHRIDDMALCTEARIDGTLQLAQPLFHAFPANDTWVAAAVYLGDLQARVKNWKSLTTDVGYDSTGTLTSAQYNLVAYPIAIDNRGSVPERWKIVFTSSTAFNLFGEKRGLVGGGSIAATFSPVNPQSLTPYFTINASGWGAGWQTGNTVRFDTDAAAAPLWLIRTILPGQATVDEDQIKIELRGDHN